MKNVFLVLCTMFAFATVSVAQNVPTAQAPAKKAKGNEHGMEMKKDHANEKGKEASEKAKPAGEQGKGMGANLGLSADQQTQYGAINKAHQEAVKKVQMDASLSADAKKTQVDALKSKYEADIKGVMNADQYAKWSANRAKRAAEKAAEKEGDHKEGAKKEGDHKPKAKTDGAKPQGAAKKSN